MSTAIDRKTKLKFSKHFPRPALCLLNRCGESVSIVSGYMNPLHCGHLDYFEEAWRLGRGVLLVIVNNDKQVKLKGSQPFMTEQERLRIVSRTKPVYGAILSIDKDLSVCETLRELAVALPNCPLMFCNSGDKNRKNIPEVAVCEELGIKMKFNVGGEKTQSSSVLLAKLKENKR
jgi:cytidyltransferase-like protein